jgi:hypothetical protein
MVLCSTSAFVTTEIDLYEERTTDEAPSNSIGVEGTKHYHERNQTSFGSMVEIGTTPNIISDIAVGDLDNNGTTDLVTAYSQHIKWRNSRSPFSSPSSWTSSPSQFYGNSVDLGDLDKDGDLDILVTDGTGIFIYQNPVNPGGVDPWTFLWTSSVVGSMGPSIITLKFADFDNDGDLDIVSANSSSIVVWENPKKPGGDPWTFFSWGTNTVGNTGNSQLSDVEVADVDLDGLNDVVSGDSALLRIWKNDGTPFTDPWLDAQAGVTLIQCTDVEVGDLDNDGDADILSGSAIIGLAIYVNPREAGDPFAIAWPAQTNIPIPNGVSGLTLADYDNDGWLDIGLSASSAGSVAVLENDQTPWVGASWHQISVGNIGGAQLDSIEAADFDNDGDIDLIASDTAAPGLYSIYIWNNTLIHRNMPFSPMFEFHGDPWVMIANTGDIEFGDIDNDGALDIVTGYFTFAEVPSITIWKNSGFLGFWSPTNGIDVNLDSDDSPAAFPVDLDNDGNLDIASLTNNNGVLTLYIWENPLPLDPFTSLWSGGVGVLISGFAVYKVQQWCCLDVADFDGDGDIDIVTYGEDIVTLNPTITIWGNPTTETGNPFVNPWSSNQIGTTPGGQVSLDVGDLDNDGDVDLASADSTGEILIWENLNSTGVSPWIGAWSGGTGTTIWQDMNPDGPRLELSDLDNDGDLDIPFAMDSSGLVKATKNPGNPFTDPWTDVIDIGDVSPASLRSIITGDFDNDGDSDVVTGDNLDKPIN